MALRPWATGAAAVAVGVASTPVASGALLTGPLEAPPPPPPPQAERAAAMAVADPVWRKRRRCMLWLREGSRPAWLAEPVQGCAGAGWLPRAGPVRVAAGLSSSARAANVVGEVLHRSRRRTTNVREHEPCTS